MGSNKQLTLSFLENIELTPEREAEIKSYFEQYNENITKKIEKQYQIKLNETVEYAVSEFSAQMKPVLEGLKEKNKNLTELVENKILDISAQIQQEADNRIDEALARDPIKETFQKIVEQVTPFVSQSAVSESVVPSVAKYIEKIANKNTQKEDTMNEKLLQENYKKAVEMVNSSPLTEAAKSSIIGALNVTSPKIVADTKAVIEANIKATVENKVEEIVEQLSELNSASAIQTLKTTILENDLDLDVAIKYLKENINILNSVVIKNKKLFGKEKFDKAVKSAVYGKLNEEKIFDFLDKREEVLSEGKKGLDFLKKNKKSSKKSCDNHAEEEEKKEKKDLHESAVDEETLKIMEESMNQ